MLIVLDLQFRVVYNLTLHFQPCVDAVSDAINAEAGRSTSVDNVNGVAELWNRFV